MLFNQKQNMCLDCKKPEKCDEIKYDICFLRSIYDVIMEDDINVDEKEKQSSQAET